MQLVGWGVVLGLIGGIFIHSYLQYENHVEASVVETLATTTTETVVESIVETPPKPEPKVVRIKVVTNWTAERIAQEIDKVFPDAPIMHDVMRCESGGYNDAYNPTNGSHDNGLFQISDLYHGPRVRSLGLDVGNPADNIAYARILYDESGLQPWSASKHCWSK